ncbi:MULTISPECIES: HPP family protein [Vibrio]|uniref:HPP family protein n=1 Tax=Vibrio TaxID=662 RepID=UPI000B5C35D5|nr:MULTISPECIES: HPP family protein [Vibrio]HBV76680.1 HPP family protein [Vibrio sp.]
MNRIMTAIFAGFGATVAIGILSLLDSTLKETIMLMAPFGATAVLVFGLPDSPLAQPKNVILGHLVTAIIGVAFVQLIGVTPITLAIATGLGVSAMLITKTTHPPAGANPLLIMLSGQSWGFLVTPVLLGAIIIVLMGRAMQKGHKVWSFRNTAVQLNK